VVYVKVDDDRYCIEHFGGKWQLKPVTDKGKNDCFAEVPGGCALEGCTSHWLSETFARNFCVSNGERLVLQLGVKMLFGADAEREVSRRRLCARCSTPSITARARARAFIVTVLQPLKLFMSRRPLKARPRLPLKQRLSKPRLTPKSRPSLRTLCSCCSGWTCRSTSQSSCEGEGGGLARCCRVAESCAAGGRK